jgi:hypothetical protein
MGPTDEATATGAPAIPASGGVVEPIALPTTEARLKAVGYTPLEFMPLPDDERRKALERVEKLISATKRGRRKGSTSSAGSKGYSSGQLRLLKKYLEKKGKGFIVVPMAEHESRQATPVEY